VGKKKSKQPRKTALWYLGELLRISQESNNLLKEIISRLPFTSVLPIVPKIVWSPMPPPTTPVYGVNQPPIVVMYGCPISGTNIATRTDVATTYLTDTSKKENE